MQLIDATSFWSPMRRSLGDKRREIPPEKAVDVLKLLVDFEDGATRTVARDGKEEERVVSRVYPTTHFGYCRGEGGAPEPDPKLRDTERVPLLEGEDPRMETGFRRVSARSSRARSCPTSPTPGSTPPGAITGTARSARWATRSTSTATSITTPRHGPSRRSRPTFDRSRRTSATC